MDINSRGVPIGLRANRSSSSGLSESFKDICAAAETAVNAPS